MGEEEIEINDELLEEQEGLEDGQEDAIDIDVETDEEELTDVEEETETEVDDESEEEIDYKALYEQEQEKRNKLQKALNAERKLKKTTTKVDVTETSTYKQLVANGVDESIAKTIAETSDKSSSKQKDLEFELALLKTSKKSGFEDVESYAEEIRPFVDRGLTVEQAYYVAVGEKQGTNTKAEIARQVEAKLKNQQIKNKISKVDTTGSASVSNSKKANPTDIAMAKAFGMSVEEYVALKGIDNIDAYQKFKNKKK